LYQRLRKLRGSSTIFAMLFVLATLSGQVEAAPGDVHHNQEQREAARRAEEQNRQRMQEEMVRSEKKGSGLEKITLPEEETSFFIREIQLQGDGAEKFAWAQTYLRQYENQNIGMQGISLLAQELNEAVLEKGYVTTRIYIQEQDVSSGTLVFTIMAGRLGEIRFAEENTSGTWKNAFPMGSGSILNIRDIEQGLEQMRKVPSQDVNIDIQPTKEPGKSDLVLTVTRKKPWRLISSFDDSGSEGTGKNQWTNTIAWDNISGLNDMINVSYNEDAMRNDKDKGTRSKSLQYSIPWGKASFSFNYSKNSYRQNVGIALLPAEYSGESEYGQLTTSYLLHRNQKSKTQLEFDIIKKTRKTYIEGSEIEVQRQNTTALRLGLTRRQYLGNIVVDGAVRYQRGTRILGAAVGPTDDITGSPSTRYHMFSANLNVDIPIHHNSQSLGLYSFSARGQYTHDPIYGSEYFGIGGRYTVRGFDGEQTLSAEKGLLIRQELAVPIFKKHQLYAGLDYGRVSGSATEYLLGKELAGSALGLRGGISHLQYDVFVGWPVYKPKGFDTPKQTFGFQVTTQF